VPASKQMDRDGNTGGGCGYWRDSKRATTQCLIDAQRATHVLLRSMDEKADLTLLYDVSFFFISRSISVTLDTTSLASSGRFVLTLNLAPSQRNAVCWTR
jgi:hypothetical protein